MSTETPVGVTEVSEGINVDMTADNRIVGIEVLDASEKIPLRSLLSSELDEGLVGFQKTS